jgi:vacuolar-type H+-ATPase subunit E/Vma4
MGEDLRTEQHELVREERKRADEAEQPAEQRAHRRRADKHAYLEEKLAERENSEDG